MDDSLLDLLAFVYLQWILLRIDKTQRWDLMRYVRNIEGVYRTSATLSNSSLLNPT
jgi:hypothetical protein